MYKITLVSMLLLLSLALSQVDADVEVCGHAHCDLNCAAGKGEKCKEKKMSCTADPTKGKQDPCCDNFSCTAGRIVNKNGGNTKATKGAPGAGSNLAGVTGVVVMLSAWALAMR